MTDFIYWRHPTVPGIKVEEVTGGDSYSGKLWFEMARQLYSENGRNDYREIGHFQSGAPFLYGEDTRISITHCQGMFAVATLAPVADADLSKFDEKTALGIDAERTDREQVLKLRERFLNEDELRMIPADNLLLNLQAWTIKEAVYKAALTAGIDFRKQMTIQRLPKIGPAVPVFDPKDFGLPKDTKKLPDDFFGEIDLEINKTSDAETETQQKENKKVLHFIAYSYISDDFIVSLAYLPQSARLGKSMMVE